jgi:hypothetical protein
VSIYFPDCDEWEDDDLEAGQYDGLTEEQLESIGPVSDDDSE